MILIGYKCISKRFSMIFWHPSILTVICHLFSSIAITRGGSSTHDCFIQVHSSCNSKLKQYRGDNNILFPITESNGVMLIFQPSRIASWTVSKEKRQVMWPPFSFHFKTFFFFSAWKCCFQNQRVKWMNEKTTFQWKSK